MGKRKTSKTYKKKLSKKFKTARNKTVKKGGFINRTECKRLRDIIGSNYVTNVTICERSQALIDSKKLGCMNFDITNTLKLSKRCSDVNKYFDNYGNRLEKNQMPKYIVESIEREEEQEAAARREKINKEREAEARKARQQSASKQITISRMYNAPEGMQNDSF